MFRQPVRGMRLPLRQPATWNGAWRRLFTTPAQGGQVGQLWWRQTNLLTRRIGARPTLPRMTTEGTLKRGFRFSARRKGGDAGTKAEQTLTLTQRLKKLSREYGWAAVGVYLSLSVLDFPFCFLFVRAVGAEAIGKVERQVVSSVKAVIPEWVQERWAGYWQSVKKAETAALGDDEITDKVEMVGWGVEKATERNREQASKFREEAGTERDEADGDGDGDGIGLATQLALAYAIHKSFIVLRVPLTAWLTPKIVKALRSWGWKIGKKRG